MNVYRYNELSETEIDQILRRPKLEIASIRERVDPIIEAVLERGDQAIVDYTKQFDGVDIEELVIDPKQLKITLPETVKRAIDTAHDNIYNFHKAQWPDNLDIETMPGVHCSREARPIENVGLYVPGGTAKLPSTALMLAIPALIAGCSTVVLATPPDKQGGVPPEISYVAQKTGVTHIVISGGAHAIAGMAYGTVSIPKVDKIFGPGNQYVTAAKMALQNSDAMISIDMPAGPSEVLVVADEYAHPAFVAADLLSQAEHGADSQVGLIATQKADIDAIQNQIEAQLAALPRKEMAQNALDNSFIITVDKLDQAFELSNKYAPEHLILNIRNASSFKDRIQHAGSVFLGPWTPESVGDYASGTNHTLPTYGYARMYSGVSLDAFLKQITFQELTKDGLLQIGSTVQRLADIEELEAHKQAVTKRIEELRNG